MRMLIKIVFIIFIANGIDCLGGVCDDCCDCFKEEIKEDENNTAKSLVNTGWYNAKKENLVLKIFVKEKNGIFTSKDNKYKISIESDKEGNHKIAYQNESEKELNLEGKKYAFFEIKTQEEGNTVYLYCSDVESIPCTNGIFEGTPHVSISVIACDTEKVTDVEYMFSWCSRLKELDLKIFNTKNVTDMYSMFNGCSSLTKLNLQNFNTTKVTDMAYMFYKCSSLTKIEFGQNFNTSNVTDMGYMFCGCVSLENLEIVENFNIKNVKDLGIMFENCNDDIKNKILNKNK